MGCVIHDCQPAAGKRQSQGTWCDHPSPSIEYYRCSRAKGHDGDHVACNSSQHELDRWKNYSGENEMSITIQAIRDEIEAISSSIEDTKDYVQEAYEQAESAENYAYEAKQAADRAEDYAMEAKDQAYSALDELKNIEEALDNLHAKLKDAEDDTGKSLKDDIRRWRERVTKLLAQGNTHAQIAAALGISEFLVQCIEDEKKAA